jgi:hypothetical protein
VETWNTEETPSSPRTRRHSLGRVDDDDDDDEVEHDDDDDARREWGDGDDGVEEERDIAYPGRKRTATSCDSSVELGE